MAQGTQSLLDRIPDEDTHDLLSRIPDEAPAATAMPEPPAEKHSALQVAGHTAISGFTKIGELLGRLDKLGPAHAQHDTSLGATSGVQHVDPRFWAQPGAAEQRAQEIAPISPGEENTPAGIAGSLAGSVAQGLLTGGAGLTPALAIESGIDHYDRAKAAGLPEGKAWEEAVGHGLITAGTLYGGGKLAEGISAKVVGPILAKINVRTGGFLSNLLQRGGQGVATGAGFAGSGEAGLLVAKALDKHADKEDLQKLSGSSSDSREALVNGATGFLMAIMHAPGRRLSEIPSSAGPTGAPQQEAAQRGEPAPPEMAQDVTLGQPAQKPLAVAPEAPGETPAPAPAPEQHWAAPKLAELQDLSTKITALDTRSKWLRQRGRGGEALPLDQQNLQLQQRKGEVALEIQTRLAQERAAEERAKQESEGIFSGLTEEERQAAKKPVETTDEFEKRAESKYPDMSPERAHFRLAQEEGISTKKFELGMSFDDLVAEEKAKNPELTDTEATKKAAENQARSSNEFLNRAEDVEKERAEERRKALGEGPGGEERRIAEAVKPTGAPDSLAMADLKDLKESYPESYERLASEQHWPEGSVATGKPITISGFHGSERAEKGSAYSPGVEGPILGEGRYLAPSKPLAGTYGPKISEHAVRLENPFVVTSTKQLTDLVGRPPPRNIEGIKSFMAEARRRIEAKGHDGVIVNLPGHMSDESLDASRSNVKILREWFGHSQVIEFPKAAKVEASRIAVSSAAETAAQPDPREQAIRNVIDPPRPPKPPVDEASMPEGPDRDWHTLYDKFEQDDATDRFMINQNAANLREEVKASMPQDFLSRQRAKMLAPGERPEDMLNKGMFLTIDAGDKFDEAFGRTQDRLSEYEKAKLKAMANATPEQRAIAEKIRARGLWFGQNVAVEAGIIKEAHDNYLQRLYEGGEGEQRPRGNAKFKTFTTSALPRTYDTVLDALANGKKLKIEGAIEAQQHLENEILQVKRDRNFMKAGRKAGIFRFSETDPKEVEAAEETGETPEKYKLIENPRFKDWKVVAKVELAEPDPEALQRNLSNAVGEDVPKDEAIKIYGWSKDMLQKNPASGETESLGVLGKDMMIRADGTILMKKPLYGPAELADKLNVRLKSYQYPGGKVGTALRNVDVAQQAVKAGLLKAPIVHYAKVTLDFMLGSDLKTLADLSPRTAYKGGWESMSAQEPNLRMLVAGGLKLDPGSEWTDAIHQHQTWIGNGIDRLASKRVITMAARNWLKNTLQDQVDFLFHRYIPALKARSALTGLDNDMVRRADDIAAGRVSRSEVIAGRAQNSNTLLGDLNLQRLGRDPVTQRWLNRVFFAPMWVESGIRKATEAFAAGATGEANRQMWKNVAKRYAAVWVAGNLSAALMEDPKHPAEQALRNLQRAYGTSLRALMGIDITPELAMLGRKNPNRFYIGVMGSFADTAKVAAAGANLLGAAGVNIPKGFQESPLQLAEDKLNVVGRAGTMALSGMDYRGRITTSLYESTGLDNKGNYKTTQLGKHLEGQPKGGKLAGELTSYGTSEKAGPIKPEQYPSFAAYQLEHALPIHVQGLIDSITGQIDWWETTARSLGLQPVVPSAAQERAANR